ncbi:MAG: PEP-CTERM sorting domain-containing protein [Thermomicrobiales bacterium]|nr:MAG: PEP-CTERM sorting domain-containing protein [Thermomicrobiales bacterium]
MKGGVVMMLLHMGNWYNWIIGIINGGTGNGGSVPVPGTLLAFGLGFAAFVAWRAKRVEE